MKNFRKATHRCTIIVIAAVLGATALFNLPIKAQSSSLWTEQDPSFIVDQNDITPPILLRDGTPCTNTDYVVRRALRVEDPYKPHRTTACSVDTPYGSVGRENGHGGYTLLKPLFATEATRMRTGNGSGWPLVIPNSEKLAFTYNAPYNSYYLYFYNSAYSLFDLKPSNQDGFQHDYIPKPDYSYSSLKASAGEPILVSNTSVSANGEWMVIKTQDNKLIRINLESLELLTFAGDQRVNNLSISNDGSYVATSGSDNAERFKVFNLKDCNVPGNNNTEVVSGCKSKELWTFLQSKLAGADIPTQLQFSSDQTELSMIASSEGIYKKITLTAAGYNHSRLDYLALGDSFSSGEGDTEGGAYYLAGTDNGRDNCHNSRRSYPYLIAQSMGIASDRFRSIACSGAKINDIIDPPNSYLGQDDRLDDKNEDELKAAKANAINTFFPGHIPQLEFVHKYKPKIITLTIGGNNVAFEDKLNDCLNPLTTCSRSSYDIQRTRDGMEILAQYADLKKLYTKLHDASPTSKIYVLGYPKFADAQTHSCAENVSFDQDELNYIDNSLRYMNEVIAAAARDAGVTYVDIQESMEGKTLCSGIDRHLLAINGAVEGDDIVSWLPKPLRVIGNESFHPNQLGHALMGRAVSSDFTDMLGLDTCPQTPSPNDSVCPTGEYNPPALPGYYAVEPADPDDNLWQQLYENLTGDNKVVAKEPGHNSAHVAATMLAPESKVTLQLNSIPTNLGTVQTDSEGKLSATITIPDSVAAGHHTLHAYATALSGEKIDLYQPLLVVGPEGDRDEDGIADSTDPCFLVQPAGVDRDQDGTDDACDGYVSELKTLPTNLYRARNGDNTKPDQAIKGRKHENPKRLYIERNVQTAIELGITTENTKDYDPDNDGWALISRSAGNDPDEEGSGGTNGSYASLAIEDAGPTTSPTERYLPRVSVRTTKAGCMKLTPQTHAPVTPNDNPKDRLPKIEAQDTNTCRTEPPTADTDHNNLSDNKQPLYRARNGDPAKQENPNRIYIERNLTAAEAILGKSDYDSDGDGWAMVGHSNSPQTNGLYKRLITQLNQSEQPKPTVLFLHQNKGCTASTPSSLATVKKGEVRLVQLTALMAGEVCD